MNAGVKCAKLYMRSYSTIVVPVELWKQLGPTRPHGRLPAKTGMLGPVAMLPMLDAKLPRTNGYMISAIL